MFKCSECVSYILSWKTISNLGSDCPISSQIDLILRVKIIIRNKIVLKTIKDLARCGSFTLFWKKFKDFEISVRKIRFAHDSVQKYDCKIGKNKLKNR